MLLYCEYKWLNFVNYSIRDLEILTGIKAHTIRIWEKRYGLLKPTRTHTNIRLYSDDDIRVLLNVALLNKNGFKISTIQGMKIDEISNKVLSLETISASNDIFINKLILAMMTFDETRFEQIIEECADKYGFDYIIDSIMLGFFKRIGLMWQIGEITPAKEHFVTNIFRQKLIAATSEVKIESKSGKSFLIFLPEGENHEIALLFIRYLLRKKGHHIIYLGQNVPVLSLAEVLAQNPIDYLVTSVSSHLEDDIFIQLVKDLTSLQNIKSVLIGGNLSDNQKNALTPIFHYFETIENVKTFIESIN